MKVLICAGHTLKGKGTGAVGYINESNENRILGKKIVEYLKAANTDVDYYEINEANDYLQKQVAAANKKNYDVVVQIHFNAFKTVNEAMGTEVLYDKGSSKGKEYAKRVNDKLSSIFKNRGSKERDDLYWLNNTKAPAILIETCFVDSKADTDIYKKDKDKVAKAIAEGILNKAINGINENPNPIDQKYAVLINSYDDIVKARYVSHLLKHDDNLYSEVIDYKDKYAIKIYPLSPREKAENIQKLVKEKYNAYSDIIKLGIK